MHKKRKYGLALVPLLPFLMAYKCDNNVTISSPTAGTTYCGPVDLKFDLDINSDKTDRVIVGIHTAKGITILQNFSPSIPFSGRGLSVTIPWSIIAPYRGSELWVFADVGFYPTVPPPSGSTITDNEYMSLIRIDYLTARATRTLKVCP